MNSIKIRNFGPIKEGFLDNDGWMDVKKVTVMIGDQGSGKSTVAKLFSIFSWLEKSIARKNITVNVLNTAIFKNLCIQQEIGEYFSNDTFLSYHGDVCDFQYQESDNLFVGSFDEKKYENYVLPKIQYVSAARNLLTILYNINFQKLVDKKGNLIDLASNIPYMVKDLNQEYMRALTELAKNGFALPINGTSVFFQNHNTFIKTKGKRVSMSSASSGIQSITPLLIVSRFLSDEVQRSIFEKIKSIDDDLKSLIENKLSSENENLADRFKQYYSFGEGVVTNESDIKLLEEKLKKYIPSSFINIVEEPEQNLFPTSQQRMLNSLLEFNNKEGNKLIITTHSPYIIGYLTLAIKAEELYQKAKSDDIIKKINDIVPRKSAISNNNVVIYELDEVNGTIRKHGSEDGIPMDNDYLDNELGNTNELFGELLNIEDYVD